MNILVTGGSRGIGRAIVLKAVAAGHHCAFTYVANQAAAAETLRLAQAANPDAKVASYQLDVKHSGQVEKMVEAALQDFGTVSAVVNNAAVVRDNAAVLMSNEEWEEVIATNLTGPFFVIRSLLMHFLSQRKGKIINLSSLAEGGSSGQANYAASKAGLIGLTKTLAKEYGAKGITANAVTVGYVQTDMTREHLAEHLRQFWLQHCPLKKISLPGDIANVVHYLLSPEADYINGEVIRVTGGLTYAP